MRKSRRKFNHRVYSSRQLALEALVRFEQTQLPLNLILSDLVADKSLSVREKAQLQEIVFGCVRWHVQMDWILRQFVHGNWDELEVSVRNLLRMGLYQIRFLSGVPSYAAVNETVELAKKNRLLKYTGLINGVLRSYLRQAPKLRFPDAEEDLTEYLIVTYAFPRWLVDLLVKQFGPSRAESLMNAMNQRPQLHIRVNRQKIAPDAYRELLEAKGIAFEQVRFLPEFFVLLEPGGRFFDLPGARDGMISVQDISAGLAAALIIPEREQSVLDLCAAPGGKLTYIAERFGETIHVFGLDRSRPRLKLVVENCKRLQLSGIGLIQADATQIPARSFDWILLDAPCSGLGVIRKNPDIKIRRKQKDLVKASELQRKLIREAADHVKPGGILVYSTCTINKDENEKVIEDFIQLRPDFKIERPTEPFFQQWVTENNWIQILPDEGNMDGAFAVKLRRSTS